MLKDLRRYHHTHFEGLHSQWVSLVHVDAPHHSIQTITDIALRISALKVGKPIWGLECYSDHLALRSRLT